MLRSDWFSSVVRDRIAFEAGRATGGRVEIGSFHFDWRTLRVELGELVIHGTEPSSGPPCCAWHHLAFTLKPAPLLKGTVDLDVFEAIKPQAHLFIDPSGQTNLPGPAPSQRPRTLFNLAIRHFTVRDGEFDVNSSRNPWSATGANFRTVFRQQAGSRYEGAVSIEPLELRLSQDLPITLHVKSIFTVAKNQICLFQRYARFRRNPTPNFRARCRTWHPRACDFQYKVQLSLGEASRVLKVRARQSGVIAVEGSGHFAGAADYIATGRLHASNLSFGEGARAVRGVTADSAVRIDPLKIELTGLAMEALGGSFTGASGGDGSRPLPHQWRSGRIGFGAPGEPVRQPARALERRGGGIDRGSRPSQPALPAALSGVRRRIVISPAGERNPVRGAIDASYDGERGLLDSPILTWRCLPPNSILPACSAASCACG